VSDQGSGNGRDVTLREYATGQKLFSRYRLIKTLGRGGMGIVWLAHDEELERDVALKFLPDLVIHDRAVLNDLKRETRRSLELTHKNIVRIYDFVHDDISGCISMEYIDGDTLSNLRADKPCKIFEPDELSDWVSQLCDALDYAHNHARIVHRDLKPTNLLVNKRSDLKVSDFGIARSLSDSVSKLTVHRSKSGTLVYMSPQQLDGERGDHLDDIYSFGATFYELLTSKPPFYSGNVDRQIREKIPPPMMQRRKELEIEGEPIDPAWEKTIAACLAKEPARRPQSVTEVAHRLEVPSPKTRHAQQTSTKKSKRVPLLAAAVILVCLAAIGGWYFGFHKPPTQVPPQANSERTREAQGRTTYASGVGGVKVNTSPPGATVMLGGLGTKKTPATFEANSGKYSMYIELDGYEPVAKEVQAKESQLTDLGTITLQRSKSRIDLETVPPGAKVFQGENLLGVTPLHNIELPSGPTTFLLVLEGYLPREYKGQLVSKELFKPPPVPLAKPLPVYVGTIPASLGDVRLTIKLGADLKSGTMTQSNTQGDTVLKFAAVWDGAILRAKTREVVSQPEGIDWHHESFALRFSDDGKAAGYECNYGTENYTALLSAP
jgi:serine/threonine protein kinase